MEALKLSRSPALFAPVPGGLIPLRNGGRAGCAAALDEELARTLSQKHFPCVGALQSLRRRDYLLGIYAGFGSGSSWRELRADLLYFLAETRRTGSPYLTFWAMFPGETATDEDDFEARLWRELSSLTSEEDRAADWGTDPVQDPADPAFQLRFAGEALFAVGLHPLSSRRSRRFGSCAVVFNAFSQFAALAREGRYEPMVSANRKLDTIFDGEPNPMVVAHGEKWESIQFSGARRPSTWKCPFSFLRRALKP